MSDNICGPSNGLKSFVQHADRDRSLHQDRITSTPQANGGTSFRSGLAPTTTAAADGSFQSFQAGSAVSPAPPESSGNLHQYRVPNVNPRFDPSPAAIRHLNAAAPQIHGSTPGWIEQFNHMSISAPHHHQTAAIAPGIPAARSTQQSSYSSHAGLANSTIPFAAAPMGYTYAPQPLFAPEFQHAAHPHAQQGVFGIPHAHEGSNLAQKMPSDEAFNEAFGEYDDDGFQAEIDAWMSRHGPTADALRDAHRTAGDDPQEIDATMEQMARELDTRRANGDPDVLPTIGPEADARRDGERARKEQDDLANAAMSILESVKDNQTEKFKNSSFLGLMRRIKNMEVTVDGDRLVDAESGETIAIKETDRTGVEEGSVGATDKGKGNVLN